MSRSSQPKFINVGELVDRLYALRVDISSGYEKPYKPALILSTLDLIGSGQIKRNRIELSDALIERYKAYIGIVSREGDQPNIALPYWHLCGDGIWMVFGHSDEPLYAKGSATLPNASVPSLRKISAYAAFEAGIFNILDVPNSRELVRGAIIVRFFPQHRDKLLQAAADWSGQPGRAADSPDLQSDPGRGSAFSNLVRSAYEFRCAACDVQLSIDNQHVVEGCHLIPFKESYNDHPSNGISLCRNHHWALDRHLITPSWSRGRLIWVVSPRITEAMDARSLLRSLDSKPVALPTEGSYLPSGHALKWRSKRLLY